jgi:hypothetical protein
MLTKLLCACAIAIAVEAAAQAPAFPGAEGYGAVSVGGRGGDVYRVTSLQDTNTQGTLRHAVGTAPAAGRTVVFDVSGNIHLTSSISVRRPKITIAGQTAPGQGITLSGGTLWLENDDLIVRHIRTRLGATPANGQDAISILDGDRVIVDHSSASWSTDEVMSVTRNSSNNTIQWSLITEPLNSQNHSRSSLFRPGDNVPATTPTAFNLSVHHNLYAHGADRNPVMSTYNGHTLNIDFRNNVVFDWKNQASHSGDVGQFVNLNLISNYYVVGLTTRADIVANPKVFGSGSFDTVIYHNSDNLVDATRTDGLHNGVYLPSAIGGDRTQRATPFNFAAVTTESANDAYNSVLAHAGAFWWNRDPVDDRVVTDVHEISDPDPAVRANSGMMLTTEAQAGGLPVLPIETRAAGWDTDNDGMPGLWELKHGLNANVGNHNADFDADGYTDLEEYLNELGAFPSPAVLNFDAGVSNRFARAENWSANWQPSRFDTAAIANGSVVVDAVGQHAGVLQVAPDSGQTASLGISGGWLEVHDTLAIATAGSSGAVNLSGGALRVGTISKGASGSFNFTGGVLSADAVQFSLTNNGGVLSPGETIGTTSIVGDFTINDGALAIDLATPTVADSLDISGVFTLGGDLNVSLLDGFDPASGSWVIANANSFSGAFDSVTPGFAVTQQGNDLVLSVAAALPGDYNSDSVVDAADYTVWRDGGSPDNTVEGYNVWVANYGASVSASSSAVPEPSAITLAALGCVWLINHARVRAAIRVR